MTLRVLSWNLYHGRAVPPAGRSLVAEFSSALAGWPWDVALLQEVPPWWAPALARASGAAQRTALTSRNALPGLRRLLADRHPDVMKSGGGGANAILVRGQIVEHRVRTLRRWPERRVLHAARLACGLWSANLHATAHHDDRARADVALARTTALEWAADAPLVLGGDLNLHQPVVPGFVRAAGHDVDHIFSRGLEPAGAGERLEHGSLSDHAPVAVTLVTRAGDRG